MYILLILSIGKIHLYIGTIFFENLNIHFILELCGYNHNEF